MRASGRWSGRRMGWRRRVIPRPRRRAWRRASRCRRRGSARCRSRPWGCWGRARAWRREVGGAARMRLLALSGEAVEAVQNAIRKGDGRLALSMLKGLGVLAAEAPGEDEPKVVAKEMDLARRTKRQALSRSEIDLG